MGIIMPVALFPLADRIGNSGFFGNSNGLIRVGWNILRAEGTAGVVAI